MYLNALLIPFFTLSTPQVIKQRMQTRQFTSAPDAVRLIVSKEGFKGLYAVCILPPNPPPPTSISFFEISFDTIQVPLPLKLWKNFLFLVKDLKGSF